MQYDYYFEEPGKREERWGACVRKLMEERIKTIRDIVKHTYENDKEKIDESFYKCISDGMKQVSAFKETGAKGSVRYMHFSYLLNSVLTGQMLLKIDCYDENYFSDINDIDCYWDYSCLFPEYPDVVSGLEEELFMQIPRLTMSELQKAKLYFQVCNFMALEEIIQLLVEKEQFIACIRAHAEPVLSIFYGAYLDQAELICELGGD